MMFAMALDFDIAQKDHIVVAGHILKCPREFAGCIGLIPIKPFAISIHDAFGRVFQTRPFRIITGPCDQRSDGLEGLLA